MARLPQFKTFILSEDDDYIIINKPAGISTLSDRQPNTTSILDMARKYTSDPQVCHRLDKETTGCLAIAKHPEAYRHLSLQFQHRTVAKIYHAITNGIHQFEGHAVTAPLGITRGGLAKVDGEGKPAETVFYSLENYKKHTLVECYPITGRLHQIRIHLTLLKAPIVSDSAYGGAGIYLSDIKVRKFNLKKDEEEQPLMKRVALHAFSLTFEWPNGERKTTEAPYPKDMAALKKQLDKWSK